MKSNRDFQVASLPRIWAESFAGLGITLSILKMYISLICVVNGLYKKENDTIIGENLFFSIENLRSFVWLIYLFICVCVCVCVFNFPIFCFRCASLFIYADQKDQTVAL